MNKLITALFLFGLVSVFSAKADSVTSTLNTISSPSIGTGNLGVVTITQNSFNTVEFNVALSPDTAFVSTGGPHNAFTFNLDLLTPYIVSFNGASADSFVYSGGPEINTPYGSFINAIDCPGCGPGGSNAYSGVLDFTITAADEISFNNFVANTGGYYFSADVIGPSGGTGNIAATEVAPVPEPHTYAMILVGLGLIGFTARHRKDVDV
jgi:hypothetical protein